MPYSSKAVEKMERQVPAKAAKAVKIAYKEALNAGMSVLVASHGVLYRVSPDGGRTAIRQVAKRIPVAKGTKIRLG